MYLLLLKPEVCRKGIWPLYPGQRNKRKSIEASTIWEGDITAPPTPGDYTLTIRAEDAAENVAETTVDYSVVTPTGGLGVGITHDLFCIFLCYLSVVIIPRFVPILKS
jgi:hypothetical protein